MKNVEENERKIKSRRINFSIFKKKLNVLYQRENYAIVIVNTIKKLSSRAKHPVNKISIYIYILILKQLLISAPTEIFK